MRKQLLWLIILPSFLLLIFAPPAAAQGPVLEDEEASVEWRQLDTEHFVIVYADRVKGLSMLTCACGIREAEQYEAFVDDIYQDLVAVFGAELETPINLRLFPTEESYYEVNPLARQITGVIAHALNNRTEIAIALPRTRLLSDEEIVNNLRHELTHFFASLLSDGKLTTGFQEGIAQYLEKPTERANYDPTLLQQALDQGRLLSWTQLDSSRQVWQDPQVAYPQALSIAAFLIDRYGFARFVDFIKVHATEPGYRSALQVTYGKSADELEAEWLAYLPEYFAGRWQINAIYAYDLSRVTELVNRGAYTDAEAELSDIVQLLETTHQNETLAEAEQLLTRARQGQAANQLSVEARQALQNGDYALSIEKANAAIDLFETLAYRDRIPELQVYIQRAEIGLTALDQLEQGARRLDTLRFFEAEAQIQEATIMLQSLENEAAAERGLVLLDQISMRQRLAAYAVLTIGGLLLIFNSVRRFFFRLSANPLEVEFT